MAFRPEKYLIIKFYQYSIIKFFRKIKRKSNKRETEKIDQDKDLSLALSLLLNWMTSKTSGPNKFPCESVTIFSETDYCYKIHEIKYYNITYNLIYQM